MRGRLLNQLELYRGLFKLQIFAPKGKLTSVSAHILVTSFITSLDRCCGWLTKTPIFQHSLVDLSSLCHWIVAVNFSTQVLKVDHKLSFISIDSQVWGIKLGYSTVCFGLNVLRKFERLRGIKVGLFCGFFCCWLRRIWYRNWVYTDYYCHAGSVYPVEQIIRLLVAV